MEAKWVMKTLLLGMMVPSMMGELRWAIMSTFPLPMPVMQNAQVFPRFFTTNRELGLAFLPLDPQIQSFQDERTLSLVGSLCFTVISSLKDNFIHMDPERSNANPFELMEAVLIFLL